jgi:hypothetical protein
MPDEYTLAQLLQSKRMMPSRIWFAAQDPKNGFWLIYAGYTRARMNNLVRKGWKVYEAP